MKILVIGDPHFKLTNKQDTDVLHKQSLVHASNEKPDIIVVLGDTLDSFERINSKVLRRASTFIAELSAIAPLYLLIGNHDLPNNNSPFSEDHPFTQFALTSERITVIDTPQIHHGFLFVPYLPPERFLSSIEKFSREDYSMVFSHQEFAGCAYHGGEESKVVERWPEDQVLNISGHIHKRQTLNKNLFYPGTPYQINFGETDKKGIFVVDSETKEIRRLKLAGMKRKVTLRVEYEDFEDIPDKRAADGNRLRIIIVCSDFEEEKTVKGTHRYKSLRRAGVILRTEIKKGEKDQNDEIIAKVDLKKKFIPSLTDYLGKKGEKYVQLFKELRE